MKIVVVGGGPAGLYFAVLMKKADPAHRVTVLERNRPDDTFGWGVVFSDQTLGNLQAADPHSYQRITGNFARWDDIDIHVRGEIITSGGHGFSGIARKKLLQILRERAADVGVEIRFQCDVADETDLPALGLGDYDLLVAADGVNSRIRAKYARHFQPDLDIRSALYTWLGTTRLFDAFTFLFVENAHGVFQAHAYRFDGEQSAFIVECDEASWRSAGFGHMSTDETIARCEEMFAPWLEGHRLESNARHLRSPWLQFVRVSNQNWHHRLPERPGGRTRHVVLIGDAAHTAHFSIGSGTKLAMEDAIVLARILRECAVRSAECGVGDEDGGRLAAALDAYEQERKTEALRLQNAARNSMEWFENVKRYIRLDPPQFAYSLLTRSQRVSHENLRLRDARYLEGVERWFASRAESRARECESTRVRKCDDPGGTAGPAAGTHSRTQHSGAGAGGGEGGAVPPMFTPFRLRDITLPNRVVVSPMDMYSAVEGTPNDFHMVHLGARAMGGAGLVVTEMTCVSPEARITLGCTGMYTREHVEAWTRICAFVHEWSPAKLCVQLGHSGRKGSTRLMWEGIDEPLADGNWDVMGPSALPYGPANQVPREMTRADMDRVLNEFVRAAKMAIECGFDMLELHCAHGYLLSSFITPLSNRRTDRYGGSLEGRLRYPLEVFAAMRTAWPDELPMSVRISATDWVDDGIGGDEAVEIARAFQAVGADIIHVSSGQTSPDARPVYGRMFQTPFSDRIRNEAGIPTIAVGNITDADQVNGIIAAGRADLCSLARPHLSDPHWTLHAAAELGYAAQPWPVQYLTGKQQLERQLQRQAELLGGSTI
ncbi:bifunctional salicylyl-CoA 5-hydroxylase/oxidoreductase [soil metagenome]|nr:bifunctional salicylyl-CoA 5-hydroxylase/oxidoreductase [Gemmatimonadota bacterium]